MFVKKDFEAERLHVCGNGPLLPMIVLFFRVRQKEAEEEERSREYMEDRMQAILSLKGNIETNKV